MVAVDCVWDNKGVSPLEAYEKWRSWADGAVCCDYALTVGITWWGEKVAADMEKLVSEKGKRCRTGSQRENGTGLVL